MQHSPALASASRLAELDQITRHFFNDRGTLEPVDRKALLARARKGQPRATEMLQTPADQFYFLAA